MKDSLKIPMFVGLTYLFAWSWWVPMAINGTMVKPGVGWPTHLIGLMSPSLAALIVTYVFDKSTGIIHLLNRAKKVVVNKFSVTIIAITAICAFAPVILLDSVDLKDLSRYSGAPEAGLLAIIVVLVLNGYGEELGWRGFLAHELLKKHSLIKTSTIIWAIWMPWHLPLFWVVQSYTKMGIFGFIGWAVTIYFGSVFLTWFYRYNRESVLVVVIWHVTYNYAVATDAAVGLTASIISAGVIFLAILAIRSDRAAGL